MYRRDVLGVAAGSTVAALGGGVARAGTARRGARAGPATSTGADEGPAEFAPLASLPVEAAREAVVGPDGTTVFLAVEDGFAAADVSDPAAPRLLVERRGLPSDGSAERMVEVQDVSVDGDRLLVVGPAHPREEGPKAALLYDVSDPADPRRVAVHRTEYPIHNGALEGGRAYLTANDGEANPIEIVEMEGGSGPRVVGRWSVLDADGAWADVPAAIRPVHDVSVQAGIAYCSYWDAGTWLVDVSDPAAPRALGRVGERSAAELAAVEAPGREATELPGNHHSVAVDGPGTLLAVGHEAWDADDDGVGGPGGIDLVDVSSPGAPESRSTIQPLPTDDPSRRGVWTTAHNFELRGDHLYSAWYQGGVRVHDVSDPGAPEEVAAWRDGARARFWTAQVAGGAVVATSMGTDDAGAGLYTFPDPAPGATAPGARRVTVTPGRGGFGPLAALAGAGLASLLAGRRRRG